MSRHHVMVQDAFRVLPPLSPELPAPPRAPPPHRVAPPVAPRREKTAFVILNDIRDEPSAPSKGESPGGRVSPFRGRGFRENTSRHASREPSPTPVDPAANKSRDRPRSRSMSRLPVATPRIRYERSTPSSPSRGNTSGIPTPVNRRNSLSPDRAMQALTRVGNKTMVSPTHQGRSLRPPRHGLKPVASPKRVGPMNGFKPSNNGMTKPPIAKVSPKESDRSNLTSPYRKLTQPTSTPDLTKSPSRIPRTRSVSRNRDSNVRATSPVRAVVRQSQRIPLKIANVEKNVVNGVKKYTNEKKPLQMEKKIPPGTGKKTNGNVQKKNGINAEKKNGLVEKNNQINGNKNDLNREKKNVTQSLNKNEPDQTGANAEKKNGTQSQKKSDANDQKPIEVEPVNKIPPPIEAVVSTINEVGGKSPNIARKEVRETIETTKAKQIESPPAKTADAKNPADAQPASESKKEDVPEPTATLVRTTTAPALELAQPDVIPTILPKGEQEISKSISEGPSVEDKCENPGDVLASVESVRSTSSVETVRAAPDRDGEVLNANNLMKGDNHRTIAWDKTPEHLNNSVHPLESPTLPAQPPKKRGPVGRLLERACCGCRPCGRMRLGAVDCCKRLTTCSSCKRRQTQPEPAPEPAAPRQGGRARALLNRINCFRWCKRRRQPQPPADVDAEEGRAGCCAGCKARGRSCFRAMFCLNRACCNRLRNCCKCYKFDCCGIGGCCGPNPPQLDRRKSRMSVRKSQTSIPTQGISKLDPTFVEHQSPMLRGAVPVLPLPLAWVCCILNVFLPGTGTLLSGLFCMCFGKPRFSVNDSYPARLGALCINTVVAVSQLFTVLFCLVGWGWSIWWGVMMVKFGRKQKRILLAERSAEQPAAASVAVNQNHET